MGCTLQRGCEAQGMLAHEVQESQPLLVHSQPPLLPGGESALEPQGQCAVKQAGVIADVGPLEKGLVALIKGGVVSALQHTLPVTAARPFFLGPYPGVALGALHTHTQVAAAYTLFIGYSVAVLACPWCGWWAPWPRCRGPPTPPQGMRALLHQGGPHHPQHSPRHPYHPAEPHHPQHGPRRLHHPVHGGLQEQGAHPA